MTTSQYVIGIVIWDIFREGLTEEFEDSSAD